MPTISEQLTQLVSDRDDLVDNLTTKGITGLTGNETFTELVPEVLNIPSGGGRDWSEIGYSAEPQTVTDGFNYAKTIYDNWDSTRTNYSSKFRMDSNLKYMPLVDTSNGTTFSGMFQYCLKLENVPQLNTSNGSNFANMFLYCTNLKYMPLVDTSNGTNFGSMFYNCSELTTVPQFDTTNCININGMFKDCPKLTTIAGLLNLGSAYLTTAPANYSDYKLDLSFCSSLTHDSLMNVINNLYDIATKGCNTQQLILGSTNLAKLSASEIQTATDKGWSLS